MKEIRGVHIIYAGREGGLCLRGLLPYLTEPVYQKDTCRLWGQTDLGLGPDSPFMSLGKVLYLSESSFPQHKMAIEICALQGRCKESKKSGKESVLHKVRV